MKEDLWDKIINKDYEGAARGASTLLQDTHALDAIHVAGLALVGLDRIEEGYEWLCASLSLASARPDWFCNAAMSMIEHKDYLRAQVFLSNGSHEHPGNLKLSYLRGLCFCHMQAWQEAIPALDATLELVPDFYHANMSKGFCLHMLGRYDEALEQYRVIDKVVDVPEQDLEEAINNIACVMLETCRHQEGLDLLNTRYPDTLRSATQFNKAFFNLGLGNWPLGWDLYKHRQLVEVHKMQAGDTSIGIPRVDQPLGETLDEIRGKNLFLFHEQGLGDTLQFVRYAKLLRPIVNKLTIGVPKQAMRLIKTMDLGDEFGVVAEADRDNPVYTECDIAVPMLNCPSMFRTTVETIPEFGPYFHVPQTVIDQRLLPDTCKPLVGLVWAGASRPTDIRAHSIDGRRSIPYSLLEPLLAQSDRFQFVSLQMPDNKVEDPRILQPIRDGFDVLDTAGVVKQLDLVITIDSSICHLAAALGKPTWMLSRFDGCWRWLWDGREDTAFYPTMRIFRQKAHHTWPDVIDRVAAELAKHR